MTFCKGHFLVEVLPVPLSLLRLYIRPRSMGVPQSPRAKPNYRPRRCSRCMMNVHPKKTERDNAAWGAAEILLPEADHRVEAREPKNEAAKDANRLVHARSLPSRRD